MCSVSMLSAGLKISSITATASASPPALAEAVAEVLIAGLAAAAVFAHVRTGLIAAVAAVATASLLPASPPLLAACISSAAVPPAAAAAPAPAPSFAVVPAASTLS